MVVEKSYFTHLIEDHDVIMMIYGWFGKYLVGLGLNLARKIRKVANQNMKT